MAEWNESSSQTAGLIYRNHDNVAVSHSRCDVWAESTRKYLPRENSATHLKHKFHVILSQLTHTFARDLNCNFLIFYFTHAHQN